MTPPERERQRLRSVVSQRDQAASPFSAILMRLLDGTGAVAAALVDQEGETVDYAGARDPFDIKVTAAELRLVLQIAAVERPPDAAPLTEMWVRASKRSFAVIALSEGYALVLELLPRAFTASWRAINEAVHELHDEAGLDFADQRSDRERWARVEVRTAADDERRPEAIWVDGAWSDLELLGHYWVDAREVGFRARLPTGVEMMLVRERLGRWYADVLPMAE